VVKIRLRREGKKKYPVYRLVVADIRKPRNGGYLEALGQYNPNTSPVTIAFREARVEHWLRKGAQPTDTVRSLLRRTGFWLRWTLIRQGQDDTVVKSVIERWQMQQADKAQRDAERRERRAKNKKKKAADVPAAAAPAPAAEAPAQA
jgi:small subunit ribosomal protein S16